jgi:hypothetical protein
MLKTKARCDQQGNRGERQSAITSVLTIQSSKQMFKNVSVWKMTQFPLEYIPAAMRQNKVCTYLIPDIQSRRIHVWQPVATNDFKIELTQLS